MEEVLGADSTTKQLPGPFKALPRLLRDDALAHLKREYKGTVTLPSSLTPCDSKFPLPNAPILLPRP